MYQTYLVIRHYPIHPRPHQLACILFPTWSLTGWILRFLVGMLSIVCILLCFIGTQLSTGAAIETYRRGHRK